MIAYDEFLETFRQIPFYTVKQEQDLPIYYREFARLRERPKLTVLEFGVAGGGSLHFYRSILGKDSRIIGVDLNPDCLKMQDQGFEIFIGDQSDSKFLENLFQAIGKVDIIIEDGGHTNFQQITTILNGIPHVNDGGVILIDDMQCSYHPRWGNPSKWSTMNFLKQQITEINYRSKLLQRKNTPGVFSQTVESITFYESLVVIRVDKSSAKPGAFITSIGNTSDYSRDYRYSGSSILERVYKISKIVETQSHWVGKFGIIMNLLLKSSVFRKLILVFVKWIISFMEVKRGHRTRKFFS